MERDTSRVRFVTHRLIGDAEITRAAEAIAAVDQSTPSSSSVGRWMMSSTTCSGMAGRPAPNGVPVRERRPSIVCLAVKNGKSVPKSSLCSTRYSVALDECLVEQPPPRHERRDVGVDVRMTPDDGDRLVEPRMTHVGDHDRQLRMPQRDLVEQDRPCLQQGARAGEGRALVDQHRQLEPLERLADPQELPARGGRRSGRSGRACTRRGRGRPSSARARRSPTGRTGRRRRSRSAGRGRGRHTRRRSRSGTTNPDAGALNARTTARSTSASASR